MNCQGFAAARLTLPAYVDGRTLENSCVCKYRTIVSGAGTIFQQGGQAWCVTQPFQAGGVGALYAPPPPAESGAEPRRQTHLGNNRLEIN